MADLAVIGAGILGLAHAYHAARAGWSVSVFERDYCAQGASVRNFGMLAIVAQSGEQQLDGALRTLACWQHIAPLAGLELKQSVCLFLAAEPEELDVLQEFAHSADSGRSGSRLLTPEKLNRYAPALRTERVLGGLWNPDAWKVDQRQATSKIASWLKRE